MKVEKPSDGPSACELQTRGMVNCTSCVLPLLAYDATCTLPADVLQIKAFREPFSYITSSCSGPGTCIYDPADNDELECHMSTSKAAFPPLFRENIPPKIIKSCWAGRTLFLGSPVIKIENGSRNHSSPVSPPRFIGCICSAERLCWSHDLQVCEASNDL